MAKHNNFDIWTMNEWANAVVICYMKQNQVGVELQTLLLCAF